MKETLQWDDGTMFALVAFSAGCYGFGWGAFWGVMIAYAIYSFVSPNN